MREYYAEITDGGNAHLQAFVRPHPLIHASKPSFPDTSTLQKTSLYVTFSVLDFLNFNNSAYTLRAFSARCSMRIAATQAVLPASDAELRTAWRSIARCETLCLKLHTERFSRCRRDMDYADTISQT